MQNQGIFSRWLISHNRAFDAFGLLPISCSRTISFSCHLLPLWTKQSLRQGFNTALCWHPEFTKVTDRIHFWIFIFISITENVINSPMQPWNGAIQCFYLLILNTYYPQHRKSAIGENVLISSTSFVSLPSPAECGMGIPGNVQL